VKGSVSWPRVHAYPRSMGPKMDSLLYAILGSLLRNRFVLPLWIRQTGYLRTWKPVPSCLQFDQQRVLSRIFLLLLPPSSSSGCPYPPPWRNEKPQLSSWKLKPNPTAIREGLTERKTALETTGSTIRRLRGIKFRCWTATCYKGSVSVGPCELRC
jgi:hypothetical protein